MFTYNKQESEWYRRENSPSMVLFIRIVLDSFYLLSSILRNSQLESDICRLL